MKKIILLLVLILVVAASSETHSKQVQNQKGQEWLFLSEVSKLQHASEETSF